jgi:hypothetical protein
MPHILKVLPPLNPATLKTILPINGPLGTLRPHLYTAGGQRKKIDKLGFMKIQKNFIVKEPGQGYEKSTQRMGENICKSYM